jgi:hypothetical protein
VRRLAFGAALLLAGCVSAERSYVEPTGPDVARLSGKFVRESITDWERYAVRGIDQKRAGGSFLGDAADVVVSVTPGEHRVFVHFEYNRTRSGQLFRGSAEPTEAYYILQGRFESGKEYQLNGKVGAQFTEVWVEEKDTRRTVSLRVACVPRTKSALTPAVCSKPAAEGAATSQDQR